MCVWAQQCYTHMFIHTSQIPQCVSDSVWTGGGHTLYEHMRLLVKDTEFYKCYVMCKYLRCSLEPDSGF